MFAAPQKTDDLVNRILDLSENRFVSVSKTQDIVDNHTYHSKSSVWVICNQSSLMHCALVANDATVLLFDLYYQRLSSSCKTYIIIL
jgi:ADP-heptose:LPS heptosyltransferase